MAVVLELELVELVGPVVLVARVVLVGRVVALVFVALKVVVAALLVSAVAVAVVPLSWFRMYVVVVVSYGSFVVLVSVVLQMQPVGLALTAAHEDGGLFVYEVECEKVG